MPSACLRGAHLQVIAAPLQRLQAEIARGVDFAVLCNQHLANSLFPRDARQCQLQLPVPAINWLPAALHAAAQGCCCCCCLLCSVHVVLTSQRISPVVRPVPIERIRDHVRPTRVRTRVIIIRRCFRKVARAAGHGTAAAECPVRQGRSPPSSLCFWHRLTGPRSGRAPSSAAKRLDETWKPPHSVDIAACFSV